MRGQLGLLTVDSILGETTTSLTAAVTSSQAGRLLFEFAAETTPPHRLVGIRVERTEPEDGEDHGAPAPDVASWLRGARTLLDSLSDRDAFSGVLLLAHRDSILLLDARGMADREQAIPNTATTRFNVGSINKSFTRIAIHQLETRGLLSLDDTLARLLPRLPEPCSRGESHRTTSPGHALRHTGFLQRTIRRLPEKGTEHPRVLSTPLRRSPAGV